MLGFGGFPTFKMKKMKKEDFQDAMGDDVSASIRYVWNGLVLAHELTDLRQ